MLKVCFCAKHVGGLTTSHHADFDVKNRFHKTSHTMAKMTSPITW
jgi:hypothetical protein